MAEQEITNGNWLIWSQFWSKHLAVIVEDGLVYIPGHGEPTKMNDALKFYKFIRKLDLEALANE